MKKKKIQQNLMTTFQMIDFEKTKLDKGMNYLF